MTNAERRCWTSGKRRTGDNPVTPRNSRKRSSQSQAKNPPPRRFIAGADAIATAEQKIAELKAQLEANRDLSTSLDFDAVTS